MSERMKTLKAFKDMSTIAQKATEVKGDSVSQIQSLFSMVDKYKETNPEEFAALDDFIGKRCAYRD